MRTDLPIYMIAAASLAFALIMMAASPSSAPSSPVRPCERVKGAAWDRCMLGEQPIGEQRALDVVSPGVRIGP